MVFPWHIICIGKKLPEKDITKVSVILLLSVRPFIGTEEEFLGAIVIFPTETYEQGVWSAFSSNSGGILCSLIASSMSLRNVYLHFSKSPGGTGGRVVVPALREKPHRR